MTGCMVAIIPYWSPQYTSSLYGILKATQTLFHEKKYFILYCYSLKILKSNAVYKIVWYNHCFTNRH